MVARHLAPSLVLAAALWLPAAATAQSDIDDLFGSIDDDDSGEDATRGASTDEDDAEAALAGDDIDGEAGAEDLAGELDEEEEGDLFGDGPPAPFHLRLAAGAGVGVRSIDLPRDGLVYEVRSGVFPAVELGFGLDYDASEAWTVGLLLRYQTSLGLVLRERRTDGSEQTRDTRSSRLEAGLSTTVRFGAGPFGIGGALGYAIVNLHPQGHLLTPAFHLGGPFARLSLAFGFLDNRLRLRVGPEAHLVVQVGDELLEVTSLRGSTAGMGLGGEASLELDVAPLTFGLTYRELHRSVDSGGDATVNDVARFATFRLTGEL